MFLMQHLRSGRPLRTWGLGWAMAAALALALLPTLSCALAAPTPHQAVCTAEGVVWVAGDSGPAPAAAALLQGCAMCLLAASALAPPPPADALPGQAAPSAPATARGSSAPTQAASTWRAGLPRAPPARV